MTDRPPLSIRAWSILGLVAMLAAIDIWLALTRPASMLTFAAGPAAFTVVFLLTAPVGGLIASLRPQCAIVWLMLSVGLAAVTGGVLGEVGRRLYASDLHLGAALFIASDALSRTEVLLVGLLLLLFPDGQFVSSRWRTLAVFGIAITALVAALGVGTPGKLDDFAVASPPVNPFALPMSTAGAAIAFAAFVSLFTFLVLAAVSVVARYRGAGPERRLQLKWFALAA